MWLINSLTMAETSSKPESLYNLCIAAVSNKNKYLFRDSKRVLQALPDNVIFDLYYKLYENNNYCILAVELSDLDIFARMLKVTRKRYQLLKSFQALVDHGAHLRRELANAFIERTETNSSSSIIDLGLKLGGFLTEAGWFVESIAILKAVELLCNKSTESVSILLKKLECYHKLLHAQTIYCCFNEAAVTVKSADETINKLKALEQKPNLAGLYAQYALLYFSRCEYDLSYKWSSEAIKLLDNNLPHRLIVDILCQAARASVAKREFKKAEVLINQAVSLATQLYEIDQHPFYADVLMAYGYFLLNYDCIAHSVQIYEKAFDIRKSIYDRNNIYVAHVHEDLAYALYVNEYSSGRFARARELSERAIKILNNLVSSDHLMLASAKRVKALILEEIALDIPNIQSTAFSPTDLLNESEKLHKAALELSLAAFGEKNVHTAKHYGNLGRLYQSMQKFELAEKMHIKAIAIKEELLGKGDYEVALSIGHLASLYNYHTRQYRKAEQLYFQSIQINLRLFGESYSGLEYDYRGLINVYHELNDLDHKLEYKQLLYHWRYLRDRCNRDRIINLETDIKPLEEITREFFAV